MRLVITNHKPFIEHDCDLCQYIATTQHPEMGYVDVYRSCDGSMDEYLVRYGVEGDYCTVWEHHRLYAFCSALEILVAAMDESSNTYPRYGKYQQDKRIEERIREIEDKFNQATILDYM